MIMELLLDLDNHDDLSPDIDGDEMERRMALLNPSRHRIKSLFNVLDKDDGDDSNDGYDGEENSDSDDEEDRNTAALTLTWCCRSLPCYS